MRLITKRIIILPKEEPHSALIYRWFHSGEYQEFFGNNEIMTLQGAMEYESGKRVFMIADVNSPSTIYGMIVLSMIHERNRNLCYSILIDKQFHRKKVASEASELMLYYIMNSMNMFKVWSLINKDNSPSIKLTEGFGFINEGYLKQHDYHDGEFHDVVIYSTTKGPFNKKYKQKIELSEKEVVG